MKWKRFGVFNFSLGGQFDRLVSVRSWPSFFYGQNRWKFHQGSNSNILYERDALLLCMVFNTKRQYGHYYGIERIVSGSEIPRFDRTKHRRRRRSLSNDASWGFNHYFIIIIIIIYRNELPMNATFCLFLLVLLFSFTSIAASVTMTMHVFEFQTDDEERHKDNDQMAVLV